MAEKLEFRFPWAKLAKRFGRQFGPSIVEWAIKTTQSVYRAEKRRLEKKNKGRMGFCPTKKKKKGCDPDEAWEQEPGDPDRVLVGDEEAIADMETEEEE